MEYCLLVWASLCFSWAAPHDSGAALGVSWASLGAFAMFVFSLSVWKTSIMPSRTCNYASFCNSHCSVQFLLEVIVRISCSCGGVLYAFEGFVWFIMGGK